MPERFLHEADEIEVVDAPPDVTMGDPRVLAELRELALLLAADVVDRQLQEYLDSQGVSVNWGAAGTHPGLPDAAQQRPGHAGERASQRASDSTERYWRLTWSNRNWTRPTGPAWTNIWCWRGEAGAEVHCLKGGDFAATLLAFAREQRITQLFLGHSQRDRSPVEKLIDAAEDFDVRLFPHPGTS